ncbi:hypothetical protein B0S90_2103 [Caldicellulosiruptor bescii]|uniref:Uncharacterized protein n=3 Tax=Caldicellulosiruptor TaxID=44000 RepID=B9MKN1_CALBD|nr:MULTISPECIES: hypothetical protein [Caldicellulosiruptor]ACM60889.1 conserved hypothetical protein [Caldicellulosiruptor bescii DSM 6725]ADQ45789.1 hypothetical protein Calkro_0917 [Caldicellulosiruptor kronotskyensis 2002]PBC89293.1 hypothetical protein B0S87_2384 [Caldicellulosiruptor bescii]PBC91222.1 hypothetical protein B0S89_1604 [Caldicellulosiruptor bescii]PBD03364.1 hypothetical protein B0S85_0962 [Caldicellulosiruptor bescii]
MEREREKEKSRKSFIQKISIYSKKILLVISLISIVMALIGIKFYILSLHYVSDKIDLKILAQGFLQNSVYIFVEGLGAAILVDFLSKTKN